MNPLANLSRGDLKGHSQTGKRSISLPVLVHLGALAILLAASHASFGEDGSAAWLRYAPVPAAQYQSVPSQIVLSGNSIIERRAGAELARGLSSMLGRRFTYTVAQSARAISPWSVITIGPYPSASRNASDRATEDAKPDPKPDPGPGLDRDSYTIRFLHRHTQGRIQIQGNTPRAELYGVFRLLEEIGSTQQIPASETQTASAPIRWTDEWDNLDGTIERGYAGPSFFFKDGHVVNDLRRASEYARLLSSVGIDGCNVNNVNADLDVLTSEHLKEFARLADAFRPWGVRLALSIDLTSPQVVGGLPTFDPLDPTVIAWWKQKSDEIYRLIPDFGGFTVKADSEGRKGPAAYGRSPADAANVLARALAPHGGVVLYRGFVYNNHLDWRDLKADRARAGVDNFLRFDGQFEPNVIIQIKEGPIDFQAREPVSPLFAALRHTNLAIEVEASQEYTGQQRHMVWLPSMWKWVLDTDLQAVNRSTPFPVPAPTPVKQIVEGRSFPLPNGSPRTGGFVSVTNAGTDANWMHHPMAMANLYGFGRLAWNPDEPLDTIIDTWTRLTWGNDPQVDKVIDRLQRYSLQIYEGYTGPNGIGTLTNILGYHFGPGIESAERNGWGQWFRGEADGIGMDRTAAGTGFAQQYPPALAAIYDSPATCPDDLLLFFHHVPYNYKLHSGKTLIQSIYDTHYLSARAAGEYVPQWMTLKGRVDDDRYRQVLKLFQFQAGHAIVWRDAIDDWFRWKSHIPDEQGRVGTHAGRLEAETMTTGGYQPVEVTPWETASGGKAVVCPLKSGCSLSTLITQPPGHYSVAVQYFDTWGAASHFELQVDGRPVAHWSADDTLPPAQFDPNLDGQTSTRFTADDVLLKPGDTLTLRGTPDLYDEPNSPRKQTPPPGLTPASAPASVPDPIALHPHEKPDHRELAPVDYIQLGPASALTPQN